MSPDRDIFLCYNLGGVFMKNKFKLIISSIIVLLLVISVVFYFSYRNRLEKEINRIKEIRNDVKKEAEIYLSITILKQPYCVSSSWVIFTNTIP